MNWEVFYKIAENISRRYFVSAGIAFILFYVLLRKIKGYKKIQLKFPRNRDYFREIIYSVTTIVIFTLVTIFFLKNPPVTKHTFYYTDIHKYSWIYFYSAFPIMLVVHDTYFYWMHRLMHRPEVFKYFHKVHHLSTNPSPWAAYAFHPLEALVEIGILPVFIYTMPIHTFHLLFFFLFMIIYNVYGHLGWELYPRGFSKHWLGKWVNTSVNHNQHHQYFKGNYGLYFLFWDRMMGTIRKDYDQKFEDVSTRTNLEVV